MPWGRRAPVGDCRGVFFGAMKHMTTNVTEFKLVRSTASTDTSFPSRVATITEPVTTTAGVLDLTDSDTVHDTLKLVPFGTDAANEAFNLRVIGWKKVGTLWVPVNLAEVTATLGAAVGVSGEDVTDNDFFADTLVIVTGTADVNVTLTTPADDSIAHFLVDIQGFAKVEILFDRDTAATANCLYALL